VSQVIHQSVVEVNKEGTEAAAAIILMGVRLFRLPPWPEEFKCNRPFLFVIHEAQSNAILFMGK